MLYKNVFKTLQKQYVQLILLGLIIVLSSFLYTAMEYAIAGVMEPTETYFDEANQEDFSIGMLDIILEEDAALILSDCLIVSSFSSDALPFTLSELKNIDSDCYDSMLHRRIEVLEDRYENLDLEIRESKDVYYSSDGQSYRIKFLKDMERINTSYFVEGVAPNTVDEIAVAETFAKMNGFAVGDVLVVASKEYTISGFVLFPDYNLPMFGADFILDNKTQTVGMVSNQEFENLDEAVSFEIAGVFENDMTNEKFETDIMDDYKNHDDLSFVTKIVLTENNVRSGGIYADLEGGRAYSIMLSLLIASIALMIVGIMVSRVLHAQRGPIGILKSMGYTNTQITFPYIVFIFVLALPTIFIGYYLGLLAAVPFKEMFMSFYLLPSNPIEQTSLTLIVAVVVPLFFVIGLSFIIVRRLLNQKPVTLLNPEVTSSNNFVTKHVGKYLKHMKITSKLKHLLLYRNIVKFTVFLIGMFFAAYLILFSFSMNGIFDRMVYDYYENTSHEYIGYCEFQAPCDVIGTQEKVIELPSALMDDEDVVLVGLSPDTELHPLLNKKKNEITDKLETGIIITESLSKLQNVRVGDMVTLEIGEKSEEYKIVDVTYEYSGNKAYMSIKDLSLLLTDTEDYYNVVYSETLLEQEDYMLVIVIQDVIDQVDNMQGFMNAFVWIMTIVSIVIGGIIIYILTVMTIEDNFYNISLFKVIGYNEREVNRMILGGYSIYGIGIFIITIPIAILSFILMELVFVQMYNILFPFQFEWWHALASIAIYLVIFYIGAFAANKRLRKVSLQEAMKLYQV
jgi:putative ABC transport system permease protein